MPDTPISNTLEAAEKYVERGYSVVPIPYRKKAPVIEEWQKLRLAPEELPSRFGRQQQNIGILLGEASGGLVDIDCDCPEAIRAAARLLPSTGMKSGRKSAPLSHYWYTLKEETLPKTLQFRDVGKNGVGSGDMLIELRSNGTQTAVAPSVHPEGESYVWHGEEPETVEAATLIRAVRRVAATALLARHWRERGSRHSIGLALAGFLLRGGMSLEDASGFAGLASEIAGHEDVADRVNAVRDTAGRIQRGEPCTGYASLKDCLPEKVVAKLSDWLGLTQYEGVLGGLDERTGVNAEHERDAPPKLILQRGAEAAQWERLIPFDEFAVPEFPMDALPTWARDMGEAIALATETPPDLPGTIILSVLALPVSRLASLSVEAEWSEQLNLYTVVAMPPGSRKSAVFSKATRPLVDYESNRNEAMQEQILQSEAELDILNKRLDKAKKDAATLKDPLQRKEAKQEVHDTIQQLSEFVPVVALRLVADDATPEKMVNLLDVQGGRLGLFSPEGGLFEMMAGRYSEKGNSGGLDYYLKAWCGDPITVDRVWRKGDRVDNPALTIGLTVQPDVLQGFTARPAFKGRGLLGRFLYSLPKSNLGYRTGETVEIPAKVKATYASRLEALLQQGEAPQAEPFVLRLEPDALVALKAFQAEIEPLMRSGSTLGHITDWGGKITGQTARIAGIFHVAEYGTERLAVNANTMRNAIRVARYFIEHARAAYNVMGADAEVEGAKALYEWTKALAEPSFIKRDAFNELRSRFRTVAEMERPLEILCERGYLREAQRDAPPQRGRPSSPVFEINPAAQKSHNTHKSEMEGLSGNSAFSAICAGGFPNQNREVWRP